jgi:hypothetical protein
MNTKLITRRPELAVKQSPAFLTFVDSYQALEMQYKAAQEAWGAIKAFMLDNSIDEIDLVGDRGKIVMENDRRVFTCEGDIPKAFQVVSLDTKKLNKLVEAEVDLPKGVDYTRGRKLVKRLYR